jgi:hypothetical protein
MIWSCIAYKELEKGQQKTTWGPAEIHISAIGV